MPDKSDPNTTVNPVPVTPMTPAPGPTLPPNLPSMDSDVPPPPGPEPTGGAGPTGDLQGLGIPPVITPTKPGRRVNRRMVATILGVLVLVGGLGAGVVLVRQQQLFSQKASVAEPCNVCTNNKCQKIASPPNCSSILNECSSVGASCGTAPAPAPEQPAPNQPAPNQPAPGGGIPCTTDAGCPTNQVCMAGRCQVECTTDADCGTGKVCQANKCVASGGGGGGGGAITKKYCTSTSCDAGADYNSNNTLGCVVYKYKCNDIKASGVGCQDIFVSAGKSASFTESCGTEQIDVACFKTTDKGSTPTEFISKRYASACTTAAAPGGPTAQCLAVQAFDANWTLLTSDKLSSLKVGDVVRFAIGGTATTGVNDKAKFKINGVDRPEVTGKRPGTDEFFDEYTVPAGVSSFSVGAQMHNSVLGWF